MKCWPFATMEEILGFVDKTGAEASNSLRVGPMRERFAKCFVAVGLGLAMVVAQGCKRKAALPQPAAFSVPRVPTDFVVGALPFESDDVSATPKVARVARQQPVQLIQVQGTNDQDAAIAAEAQRRQDATLLQEQQAASTKQQQELDRQVQQNLKMEQEVQEEPRIQEAPEMPLPTFQQGPFPSFQPTQEPPRIQDNPGSPAQMVPVPPPPPSPQ
jgi:hypothetical protein